MDTAIKIEQVSKTFKLPLERAGSIKNVLVNFARRKKGYELQEALNDISFEIKQGEFFGIVGRNGSGKSTLLKLLAGIYTPSQGHIEVNGKLTPFIELGVGFNPELTGRENVFLNGALLGFNRKEMTAMYDDIVKFAEIERFMDQKLKNYSSGMQVRLAFSIAIRARTDILLLDEVLAVGDAAFQQKCFDYFEELRKEKKTVVFVSHDMNAVTKFCTRAVYIKDGVLIHEGKPTEVADLYTEDNLENMKAMNVQKNDHGESQDHAITTRIVSQKDTELILEAAYRSNTKDELYVALSVIKDGVSFAELTTPLDLKLVGPGRVRFTLPLIMLNGGIYEMPVILCKKETRQLLAMSDNRNGFVIKGSDEIRGAALKLPNTWQVL